MIVRSLLWSLVVFDSGIVMIVNISVSYRLIVCGEKKDMERYKILSIEIDGQIYDLREEKSKVTQVRQVDDPKETWMIEKQKICSGCKEKHPLSSFYHSSSKYDGLQAWCKKCTRDSGVRCRKNKRLITCNRCKKVLDKTLFYKGERTCKDCRKQLKIVHQMAVKKIVTEQSNKNFEVPVLEEPSLMENF
jgi:hypothetical protein